MSATEATVTAALRDRYGQRAGNGIRFAYAAHVRSHAGFDARRTADFVAMDLWPSKGLVLHGHEIKVSRADWLRELKEPDKAEEFIPYMNHWWLVVSDAAIVRDGELPPTWGLMALNGGTLAVVRQAPRRDALPLTQTRLAALLRAVAEDARNNAPRADPGTASAEELRAELTKARDEVSLLGAQLQRREREAKAWKAAYAATGGLPCAHCGKPVKPRMRGGYVQDWRHARRADELPCDQLRAAKGRWVDVEPAEDSDLPESA